ncbi:helix-turn-helix domain-containing protein [Leucobacter chromiiresistens]
MTVLTTGSELQQQREQVGLDVREVADLTGLPAAFIELLESGRHSSPTYTHRISQAIATLTKQATASGNGKRGSRVPTDR